MKDDFGYLEKNFEALRKKIPSLTGEAGKFALMCDEKIVEIFTAAEDAHKYAVLACAGKRYSVHEIRDVPIDLGYHSRFGVHASAEFSL